MYRNKKRRINNTNRSSKFDLNGQSSHGSALQSLFGRRSLLLAFEQHEGVAAGRVWRHAVQSAVLGEQVVQIGVGDVPPDVPDPQIVRHRSSFVSAALLSRLSRRRRHLPVTPNWNAIASRLLGLGLGLRVGFEDLWKYAKSKPGFCREIDGTSLVVEELGAVWRRTRRRRGGRFLVIQGFFVAFSFYFVFVSFRFVFG